MHSDSPKNRDASQRRTGIFICLLIVWISIALSQGGCGKDEPKDAAEPSSVNGDAEDNGAGKDNKTDKKPTSKNSKKRDKSKGEAPGAKKPTTPANDKAAELAAPEAEGKRKEDRERRIDELRKRNDVRRKERLARRTEREKGESTDTEDVPENSSPAPPEIKPPPAKGPAEPPLPAPPTTRQESTVSKAPALDLAHFLALKDIQEVMGDKSLAKMGSLPGIGATEWYNSTYYATSSSKKYGVGLQVWRETTRRNAHMRYKRMRQEHNNAEDVEGVTAKTFFSYWDDIMVLTFADLTKRVVVSVSCGQSVGDTDKLFKLAKTVQEKL